MEFSINIYGFFYLLILKLMKISLKIYYVIINFYVNNIIIF